MMMVLMLICGGRWREEWGKWRPQAGVRKEQIDLRARRAGGRSGRKERAQGAGGSGRMVTYSDPNVRRVVGGWEGGVKTAPRVPCWSAEIVCKHLEEDLPQTLEEDLPHRTSSSTRNDASAAMGVKHHWQKFLLCY